MFTTLEIKYGFTTQSQTRAVYGTFKKLDDSQKLNDIKYKIKNNRMH